ANSSTIWFVYENIDLSTDQSQTYGIENEDGTIALQMAYNQAYAENQLLTKISLGADWLSADPTSGTIPAGGSLNVDLTAESGSLLGGTYLANVVISTNDPINAEIKKPTVQMTVVGTADITVTPDPVVTDTVFVGGSSVAEMLVQNTGTDVLNVFNITTSNGEFTVDPTGFMVDPGNTQVVNVTFTPTTEGAQSTTMSITSNDPGSPTLDVTATGVGLIAPAIAVNPGSITESVDFGDSTDVTIQIDNNGGSDLNWAASLAAGKTSIVNTRPTAATAEQDPAPRTEGNGDENNVVYGFGDLLVEYDLELLTGSQSHLGVEFAQNHFWITASQAGSPPNWIYKLDEGGAVVDSFSQPTTSWGWRDMAWDGTFLYGSVSPAVEQIDPATGQPTGVTIPGPENPNRALAYDPATDHFWTVNFGGSLYEFDRSGTVINTFPNPVSAYGAAWDVFTPGGPWIWLHAGTATGDTHFMVQVDPTTGISTGLQFTGTTGNIAGGLTATGEMSSYPGQAVMVALGQTFSLSVWDLDAVSTPPFASLVGNTSGTIAPGDVDGVTVRFFGSEPDTTVMGNINISSNDPVNGSIDVPYSVTVIGGLGIGDEDEIPTTFALSQNYPNPFNPSTSIRYQLPKSAEVSLVVYNTLGQKVHTLVNQRQEIGVYEAKWDGRNENGVAVSSGIYIYRFETADYKQVRKMIFLK
ncbi:MAG: FlgD immunoglobulin-like domain containing protein, partial [Calditrichota bacterium]